jgi:uncharacterized protein DUF1844
MAADDEEEQQGRGFKVQDRRRFVDDAAPVTERPDRDEHAPDTAPSPDFGAPGAGVSSAASTPPLAGHDADPAAAAGAESPFGEMSFSTFVMGLTTQALMHLGEIADPVQQRVAHDLPAAKQMIDLLGILRDKTKGNLDAAEEQLLGEVLYDLRMRYVEVARSR